MICALAPGAENASKGTVGEALCQPTARPGRRHTHTTRAAARWSLTIRYRAMALSVSFPSIT